MGVPVRDVSAAVRPVAELRDHACRRRPLGALGPGRHLREGRGRFGHEHRHGDPVPVGRPGDVPGGLGHVREFRRLAGVHPAHEQLVRASTRAHIQQAVSAGRPARRAHRAASVRDRTVIRAVRVDYPQRGARPVRHDVEAASDVHDPVAVGRYAGVVGNLHFEDIQVLEPVGVGSLFVDLADQRPGRERESEGEQRCVFLRHQAKTRGSKSSALTIEALSPVARMTKKPCRSAWRATPSAA